MYLDVYFMFRHGNWSKIIASLALAGQTHGRAVFFGASKGKRQTGRESDTRKKQTDHAPGNALAPFRFLKCHLKCTRSFFFYMSLRYVFSLHFISFFIKNYFFFIAFYHFLIMFLNIFLLYISPLHLFSTPQLYMFLAMHFTKKKIPIVDDKEKNVLL